MTQLLDDLLELGRQHKHQARVLAEGLRSAKGQGLIPDMIGFLEQMGLVTCDTMYRCQDCGRVVIDENRDQPHRYTMEVGKEDPCRNTGWVPFRVSSSDYPLQPYLPMEGRP